VYKGKKSNTSPIRLKRRAWEGGGGAKAMGEARRPTTSDDFEKKPTNRPGCVQGGRRQWGGGKSTNPYGNQLEFGILVGGGKQQLKF